jgi:hypothetical protein
MPISLTEDERESEWKDRLQATDAAKSAVEITPASPRLKRLRPPPNLNEPERNLSPQAPSKGHSLQAKARTDPGGLGVGWWQLNGDDDEDDATPD